MKVIFTYKPHSLFSWIIRFFTFSRFSHVAIMLSDDLVFDSTFKHGTTIRSYEEFCAEYANKRHTVVDIEVPNIINAVNSALSITGKPYDWKAIFGLPFKRNWQDNDAWFCSEAVEFILKCGGTDRFREEISRLTPQMQWSVK